MIGHQEFEQSFARAQDLFGIGDDLHAGFDRANTRCGKHARTCVHNAKAAHADGRLVLQMAQRRDADPIHARRIENAGARGNAHGFPVDRDVYHSRRYSGGRHARAGFRNAVLRQLAMLT